MAQETDLGLAASVKEPDRDSPAYVGVPVPRRRIGMQLGTAMRGDAVVPVDWLALERTLRPLRHPRASNLHPRTLRSHAKDGRRPAGTPPQVLQPCSFPATTFRQERPATRKVTSGPTSDRRSTTGRMCSALPVPGRTAVSRAACTRLGVAGISGRRVESLELVEVRSR